MEKRVNKFVVVFLFLLLSETAVFVLGDVFSSYFNLHGFKSAGLISWVIKNLSLSLISFLFFVLFVVLFLFWKKKPCRALSVMGLLFVFLYLFKTFLYFSLPITYFSGGNEFYNYLNSFSTGYDFYCIEAFLYVLVASLFFYKFLKKKKLDFFMMVAAWGCFFAFLTFSKFGGLLRLEKIFPFVVNFVFNLLIANSVWAFVILGLLHYLPMIFSFLVVFSHRKELGKLCF